MDEGAVMKNKHFAVGALVALLLLGLTQLLPISTPAAPTAAHVSNARRSLRDVERALRTEPHEPAVAYVMLGV